MAIYEFQRGDIIRVTGDENEGINARTIGMSGFVNAPHADRPTVKLVRGGTIVHSYSYYPKHLVLEIDPERIIEVSKVVEEYFAD